MFTKTFILKTIERAVKTAAQATLAAWTIGDRALDAFTLDWKLGLGMAAGGAIYSVLTSIASEPFGEEGTPSLVE